MRQEILRALKAEAEGNIYKAKLNIEIYLKNPVGIGEHPDIMAAIESELSEISKAHEHIEVINHYFLDR